MLLIVVEAGAGTGQHVVDVVGVRGIVVNLESDVAVGAVVNLFARLVAGRDVGEEIENVRGAHAVFEEVAALVLPFALQVSGSDGDLIRRRADHSVIGDPVGFSSEEDIVHGVRGIAAVRHLFESREMLFAAAARIVEFDAGVVADVGDIIGVEKSAVIGELGEFVAVAEATGLVAHIAGEGDRLARC